MTMFFLTWRERFSCSLYCSMIRTLTSKKDSAKTVTGCLVSLYTCIYSHFSILRWYEASVYLNVDKKNNNNQNTFASLEFSIFEIFNPPPKKKVLKIWKLMTYRFMVNGMYFKLRKLILNLLSILLNNCFVFW